MKASSRQGQHLSGNHFATASLRHALGNMGAKNLPGNDGWVRGSYTAGSSLHKRSVNLAKHLSVAKKRELESANDATIERLQESLAEIGAILPVEQDAAEGSAHCAKNHLSNTGGFTDFIPLEHPMIVAYISSCQQDNCMIYVSPQIANFGFTPEMWTGKTDGRLLQIHKDDLDRVSRALQHSRATGEKFNCRYRLYDSSGKIRWIHDEASVTCGESGSPLFISGIMLDITDKKNMEAELNGHRYYLEHKVEQRTGQLMKELAVLKSCNAALCDKLAFAQQELSILKRQSAAPTNNNAEQLDDISEWARKMIGWRVTASGAIA